MITTLKHINDISVKLHLRNNNTQTCSHDDDDD